MRAQKQAQQDAKTAQQNEIKEKIKSRTKSNPASNVVEFANMLLAKHESNMQEREKRKSKNYEYVETTKASEETNTQVRVQATILDSSSEHNQESITSKHNQQLKTETDESHLSRSLHQVEELSESLENMPSSRSHGREKSQGILSPVDKYK